MGFFGVLHDLGKNRKEFKNWEKEQDDIDAKRSALHEKKHFTPEEIKKAALLGKTVTDVIDIMDQHSEDVAEDIETTTQPLTVLAPALALLASGFGSYKLIAKPAWDKKEIALKKFIADNDIENLVKDINAKKVIFQKGTQKILEDGVLKEKPIPYTLKADTITNGLFKSNKRTIAALDIKDANVKRTLTELADKAFKEHKKFARPIWASVWATVGLTVAAFFGMTLLTTKMQVEGSRIGRWQAREKLKDEKYFVQYTDEQIKEAEENLKNKKPEKKGFFSFMGKKDKMDSDGYWKNMFNLIKERKKYKEWKKHDKDDSKLVTRELTPEEIKQAQADKEVIQRVVKKINNKAEEYSENMETAADTILLSSFLGGGALGAGFAWLINKTGFANKYVKNQINKISGEEGVKLFETALQESEKPRGVLSKIATLTNKSKNISNLYKNISENLKKANPTKKISNEIKSAILTAGSIKYARNWAITGLASALATITGNFISLALQKDAARAGRHAAKQELLNDPRNFIAHDEKDMERVKDVKHKKEPLMKRIGNYLMFVPVAIKQNLQYRNHKKNVVNKQRELKEELIKLKVSDKQLNEAKNLKRKLFNTFEKVDDKSQEYSESMEAANEMGQTALSQIPTVVTFGVPGLIVARLLSGKMTLGGLGRKVLNLFSSQSWFLKSGLAKKHLNQMSDNVIRIAKETEAPNSWVGIAKKVAPSEASIDELGKSFNLPKGLTDKMKVGLSKIHNLDDDIIEKINNKSIKEIVEYAESLPAGSNLKAKINTLIETLIEPHSKQIQEAIKPVLNKEIRFNNLSEAAEKLTEVAKKGGNIKEVLPENMKQLLNIIPEEKLNPILDKLKNANKEDVTKFLKEFNGKKIQDLPEMIKHLPENSKIKQILGNHTETISKYINNLAEGKLSAKELLEKGYHKVLDLKFFQKKINLQNFFDKASGGISGTYDKLSKTKLGTYASASFNHKTLTNYLKKMVENLPEEKITKMNEEIQNFSIQMNSFLELGTISKASLLDNIKKLDKILSNLPADELEKLTKTYTNLIKEDPKKFVYLTFVKPEKLFAAVNTPVLQNTMLALGIGSVAGTIGLSYIFVSLLAKLQKDAGRFGVMQAMKELDDVRYYANVEPTETVNQETTAKEAENNQTQQLADSRQQLINSYLKSHKV